MICGGVSCTEMSKQIVKCSVTPCPKAMAFGFMSALEAQARRWPGVARPRTWP